MTEALRILIARKDELGEAFAAKPFRGVIELSGGLCMTPLTGALIAVIDSRVDPGTWIGETAAMMSRRGPVVFAERGPDEDGAGGGAAAQAAVAWSGGKRVYAGHDGIDGLVPADPTGPVEGAPFDRALETAFALGTVNGRTPTEEAGLASWRSNDQLLVALRKQAADAIREPRPGPASAHRPMLLKFRYDAKLLDAAMAAGGRKVISRMRGWRHHLPLLTGLGAGALMIAAAVAAPYLFKVRIDLLSGGIGLLIGALVVILAVRGSSRRLNAQVMETPVMQAPIEVELTAEGVLVRNEFSETALRWEAVDDLIELNGGYCLLSGAMVIPLPRNAFPEDVDRATLRSRIAAWRGKP